MSRIADCKSVWLKGCVKGYDSVKPRRKRMIKKQELIRAIREEKIREQKKRKEEGVGKVMECVNK